jgi:hypothetical protein
VLESISGHLLRWMLGDCAHVRIDARRQALGALYAARRGAEANGDEDGTKQGGMETVVACQTT